MKALPETNRPSVIILSGHSDIETRMKLLSLGADFFIPKPVNLDEVFLIVKQAIVRRHKSSGDNDDWVLLRASLSLLCADGTTFGLSSSEYRVLEMLFLAAPEAATKEDLTEAATGRVGPSAQAYFRSLEVMIS